MSSNGPTTNSFRGGLFHRILHLLDRHRVIFGEVFEQAGKLSERAFGFLPEEKVSTLVELEDNTISRLQSQAIPNFSRNRDLTF